ncbi:hypothetical protein [Amycolatopsis benzoatilytica]|nr:hypothetical protein [Amycolatopsis benzoatilytica]
MARTEAGIPARAPVAGFPGLGETGLLDAACASRLVAAPDRLAAE